MILAVEKVLGFFSFFFFFNFDFIFYLKSDKTKQMLFGNRVKSISSLS